MGVRQMFVFQAILSYTWSRLRESYIYLQQHELGLKSISCDGPFKFDMRELLSMIYIR
jgi:hypothetical protein